MWEAAGPRDVLLSAAGSHPGDLHKLWRTRTPNGYHLEYGYSCMGYEIPGAMGAKLADPSREVFVFLGDGTYLMMPTEIVTAVQEGVKIIIVLVDNHGFASIGGLSQSLGSGGFGTHFRRRTAASGQLDGDYLPVDYEANARSLGACTFKAKDIGEFKVALEKAKAADRTTVIVVETEREVRVPGYESWWDVAVAEVSESPSVQKARAEYEAGAQQAAISPGSRSERSMKRLENFIDGNWRTFGCGRSTESAEPGIRRSPCGGAAFSSERGCRRRGRRAAGLRYLAADPGGRPHPTPKSSSNTSVSGT